MTQGAGQGPEVRTATLRDFRVPAYVYEGVRETGRDAAEGVEAQEPVAEQVAEQGQGAVGGQAPLPAAGQGQAPHAGQAPPAAPHAGLAPAAAGQPPAPGHTAPQAPARLSAHVPAQAGPVERLGAAAPAPVQTQSSAPRPVAHRDPAHTVAHAAPTRPTAQNAPAHPGSAGETPEGYTPTERDLPIINRGDTVQVEVREMPEPPPAPDAEGMGPLYVVGDVHGYLDELVAALADEGIIDADGRWSAGNTRLWFLGDFTDRGPDGIGVIDLVMRLSAEAAAAGGYCKALMGNHELLLIGAKKFGDTPVNSGAGTATFQAAWLLNGGQKTDMERLEDHHLQWMARLDAIEEEDGHLLVHSDTTAYLDYGDSIEEVNDTIHEALTRNDADEYWDLFRKFTKRFAFRDDSGPAAVRELLDMYGGARIVHGHSPIPYLLGEVGSEYDGDDDGRPVIEGPHVYADGLAIAMDGGVTMAGKLLVCRLPLES
ncbi:metallophosphoesterase [Streptomyces flavofungini]|uniref:metallophosphoesterase n=1 Tax=Streptomyces flavofungini TaxID=68200 RepID=UPI003F54088C